MNLTTEENDLLLKNATLIAEKSKQIALLRKIMAEVATDDCSSTVSIQVHNKNRCTNVDQTINGLIDIIAAASRPGATDCLTYMSMRPSDRTLIRLLQLMVDEKEAEMANAHLEMQKLVTGSIVQPSTDPL